MAVAIHFWRGQRRRTGWGRRVVWTGLRRTAASIAQASQGGLDGAKDGRPWQVSWSGGAWLGQRPDFIAVDELDTR